MPNRNAMISKIWWDLSGNIVQISWGYHGILITRSLCPIVCPGSVPKIVLQIIWRELYHLFNLDNWDLLMILYHLFIGFVPPFLWFIVPSIPIKCWLFDDLGLVRPIPNFNLPGKKKMEPSSIPYLRDSSRWLSPDRVRWADSADVEMHHVGIYEDRYQISMKVCLDLGIYDQSFKYQWELRNLQPDECVCYKHRESWATEIVFWQDCNPHILESWVWFSGIRYQFEKCWTPPLFQRQPQNPQRLLYKDV